MPLRQVLNFAFAHLIEGAQSEEDREKFVGELYAPFGGTPKTISLLNQLGG
jgi:hypothetical protein